MSSSKPSGTRVVTQSNDPWSEQIPYLKTGFERAQSDVLDKPISGPKEVSKRGDKRNIGSSFYDED